MNTMMMGRNDDNEVVGTYPVGGTVYGYLLAPTK